MPRAERRKTERSRRTWLRVRVIMEQDSRWMESGSMNDDGMRRSRAMPGRSGRDVAVASRRRARDRSRAGREDVAVLELEVDVAAVALGQGGRAVAGPAGIRDLPAAERAVDDQADLLGDRLLAGLRPAGWNPRRRMTESDSPVRAAIERLSWVRVMVSSFRPGPVPPTPGAHRPAAGAHREGARRGRALVVVEIG